MSRPRVKICGVTRRADAELAVELGAELVGINLWPRSPRHVPLERAAELSAALRGRVSVVGVVVDASPGELAEIAAFVDRIQFHGGESAEAIAPWAARAIKAVHPGADLTPYEAVWGFLVEPDRGAERGGTGESWRWAPPATAKPVLVAGGIRPENVRRAAAGAWGIDVCSGVESGPGVKDPDRMRRLFAELRRGEA